MMKKKDLIAISHLSSDDIFEIIQQTRRIKDYGKRGVIFHPLRGKTLGMMFSKSSTRTRISFEVGMYQLGGYPLYLDMKKSLQTGRGEAIKDTALVMSRYLDAIMIRTFNHSEVVELAKHATIPIINGLTDLLHPCQILSDIFTIHEKLGKVKGLKIAYIGDGNNVANSLLYGASKTGMHLTIATPEDYRPNQKVVKEAKKFAQKNGGKIRLTQDPKSAVKNCDIIYTDAWASMGQEEEAEKRKEIFQKYQVNKALLKGASKDVLVMHCLPAHRGDEITDDVMDNPKHSIIFDQAENRLHTQKAILYILLK